MRTLIPNLIFCIASVTCGSSALASEYLTVPLYCEMTSGPDPDVYTQKDMLRFNLVLEDIGGDLPYCWLWQWGNRFRPIIGDAMMCMESVWARDVLTYVDQLGGVLEIQQDGTAIYDMHNPDNRNDVNLDPVWVVTRYIGKCAKGQL